jgi:hypothetical protein
MRTAKYTWQNYKTNKDILLYLKINPVVKKIQNHRNKWIKYLGEWTDRLLNLVIKYQPFRKRSQGQPLKRLLDF